MEYKNIGKMRFGERAVMDNLENNLDRIYGNSGWKIRDCHLYVKNPVNTSDVYFATSNEGKVHSARRSLGDILSIGQIELDIPEEQESVEEIAACKAKIANSILQQPVICDDSGFFIPELGNYPGRHVARELKQNGISHFTMLAKEKPLCSYFLMVLAYLDNNLSVPLLFSSKVEGVLIGELRGNLSQKFVKSPLHGAFIVKGQKKTIAEMTPPEHDAKLATDRWKFLRNYLCK